jgi:outer membrane receptor protein involved in Fe transport
VSVIDGARLPVNYDWGYTSYSAGANYLFNADLAVFGRLSRGGRANADRLLFGRVNADGSVRSQDAIDLVDQIEFGVKYRHNDLSLFATLFQAETEEQNFEATTQRFLDRVYKAHGLELEASWYLGGFSLTGGATWTDAEISRDEITPELVGNTPRRQATWIYQLTPSYMGERYTVGVNFIGTTDAYAQDNNQLVMPGFVQTNLFATYYLTDSLSLGFSVNNLFDKLGLTEVEEGSIVEGSDNIIRARSIAGRSSTLSLRYEF